MRKAFSLIVLLAFSLPSGAAIIEKVKEDKALIDMDGLKTKVGSYYVAIDTNERKKAILKIVKVADTKAVGMVLYGTIKPDLFLERVSSDKARLIQQKARKLAQIKKKKKREARLRNIKEKRLARIKKQQWKKRQAQRRLASSGILDDLPDDPDAQSSEVLSYGEEKEEERVSRYEDERRSYDYADRMKYQDYKDRRSRYDGEDRRSRYDEEEDRDRRKRRSKKEEDDRDDLEEEEVVVSKHGIVGIHGAPQYNLFKMTPETKSAYSMYGLGGEGGLFFDFYLMSFLRVGGSLGYRRYDVSTRTCGQDPGCFVKMNLFTINADFKLNALKVAAHDLWLSGGGFILVPVTSPKQNINISRKSFSPFMGGASFGLGADLNFKNVTIPLGFKAQIHLPLSKAGTILSGSLFTGIGYQF